MEKRIIPTDTLYQTRGHIYKRICELQDLLLNNQETRRDAIRENPSFVDTEEYTVLIEEAVLLKGQISILNDAYKTVGNLFKED